MRTPSAKLCKPQVRPTVLPVSFQVSRPVAKSPGGPEQLCGNGFCSPLLRGVLPCFPYSAGADICLQKFFGARRGIFYN